MYVVLTVIITLGYKRPLHRDINSHVVPKYAHEWRRLGVLLKFEEHELDIIFSNMGNDSEQCCRRLLFKWLEKYPYAVWDHLFVAINKLPELSHLGLLIVVVIIDIPYMQKFLWYKILLNSKQGFSQL